MKRFPLPPVLATPILAGVIIMMGFVDYKIGFMLSLFPLYLLPIIIVAWYDTKALTATVALLAAAIIVIKDSMAYRHSFGFYFYWDEAIKAVLLLIIGYGVWKIKELLVELKQSNAELKQALSEIRELRQMIPICAWCHSIRNDRGFYERIEVYLSKLTGADFTHGICPECVKKYYSHLTEVDQEEPESPPRKK